MLKILKRSKKIKVIIKKEIDMKKFILGYNNPLAVFGLALFVVQTVAQANSGGRKIVVFSGALNDAAKDELIARVGGAKLKHLISLTPKRGLPDRSAAAKLAASPGVVRVDDDVVVGGASQTRICEGPGGVYTG